MVHKRKQIKDLQTDLEVINPIESKKVLGGEWYDGYYTDGGWLNNVNVAGWSGSGSSYNYGGDYQLWSGMYDYGNDWHNYGDGSGGDSSGEGTVIDDTHIYPASLSDNEVAWLKGHSYFLPAMISNYNIANELGQGQHNGYYDALRHAVWSAMDAADIGYMNANQFHSLHETEHWDDIESPSDLANNSWGYSWAETFGDPKDNMDQFLLDFDNAVKNGQINIIP